jgi:tetratricopeptide (TPR) repeat protein
MGRRSEGSARRAHALRRFRLARVFVLSSWWLCVASGSAQDPRPPHVAHASELETLRQRAEARAASGDHEGAIEAYGQALRRATDDTRSRGARGRLLLQLGRYAAARVDLERAVQSEPAVTDYRVWLGDACRALGARKCAIDAYLSVLAEQPDSRAAAGYAALGDDAFAHAYDSRLDLAEADALYASERSGFAVAAGFGIQLAGLGLQLSYYCSVVPGRLMLTPFVAYGMMGWFLDDVGALVSGPALGVMAMYGPENRWLAALSFGQVGLRWLQPYHSVVAARSLYGPGLELGREWMGHGGTFFRMLIGGALITDPYSDIAPGISVTLAGGWKP